MVLCSFFIIFHLRSAVYIAARKNSNLVRKGGQDFEGRVARRRSRDIISRYLYIAIRVRLTCNVQTDRKNVLAGRFCFFKRHDGNVVLQTILTQCQAWISAAGKPISRKIVIFLQCGHVFFRFRKMPVTLPIVVGFQWMRLQTDRWFLAHFLRCLFFFHNAFLGFCRAKWLQQKFEFTWLSVAIRKCLETSRDPFLLLWVGLALGFKFERRLYLEFGRSLNSEGRRRSEEAANCVVSLLRRVE